MQVVEEGEEPEPLTTLDELGAKAKVQVWSPSAMAEAAAAAAVAEQAAAAEAEQAAAEAEALAREEAEIAAAEAKVAAEAKAAAERAATAQAEAEAAAAEAEATKLETQAAAAEAEADDVLGDEDSDDDAEEDVLGDDDDDEDEDAGLAEGVPPEPIASSGGASESDSVWGNFGEGDADDDWMAKRRGAKEGGGIKERALAAKEALAAKAESAAAVAAAASDVAKTGISVAATAGDVAKAGLTEGVGGIVGVESLADAKNAIGLVDKSAPPAPSKPAEVQVGDTFIHLTWSMPADAGDGPYIFELSYGKKFVGTWRNVPCSATEEGFGAMKEWTTPLDGLDPGEKYLVCVRARHAKDGGEMTPWGKWSERSDDIQTSGKAKSLADAGKVVGGLAGKLVKGVAKDIDLVTTGGAITQKIDTMMAQDDSGGFWDDALDVDSSVLSGEAFEGKVLELTANNGSAVEPDARTEVIKACHHAGRSLYMYQEYVCS